MAFIEWSDKLSVLVPRYDEQHKKPFGIINTLHEAMAQGKGGQVMGEILGELIEYAKTHFGDEEKNMSVHSYPGYKLHKIEHDKLTEQVVALQEKHQQGNALLSFEIMDFLKNWLTHHILETDKMYGIYYQEKGIVI